MLPATRSATVAPDEEETGILVSVVPPSGSRRRTLPASPPPPGTALLPTGAVGPPDGGTSDTSELPRLYSYHDLGETDVCDVGDLARLSQPSCIPILARAVSANDVLEPHEAFVASLVGGDISVQEILDMSPMTEDETLRILARLVTSQIIKLEIPETGPGSKRPATTSQ